PSASISSPRSLSTWCLAPLSVHLAHLAFHPAVQNGLAQLPPVAQFEGRDFTLGDVTVERIRANPQILRRLPHIHHFARFAHDETLLRRTSFRLPLEPEHARTFFTTRSQLG